MAKDQEKALRLRLHKINLQAAGLVVRGQNGGNNNNTNSPSMFDSSDTGGNSTFPFSLRGGGGKPKRGNGHILGGFSSMV